MVKTLIVCVDRDNDLGEKVNLKGPIIGEKACIEAGKKLLLNDPEDADANSIFGAVKLKKEVKNSEVVILTGDKNVGIKSDEKIKDQLLKVIRKLKPREAVLVSDGVEDELVIPIIQSYLPIVSVRRVVVKQSEKLEGAYYMIKDFIKDLEKNPRMSMAFVGLPALALILLAIFGATGWRIILGAIGLYLLIKGFRLEHIVHNIIGEFTTAFRRGWIGFFLYTVGIIFCLIGLGHGYMIISRMPIVDYLEAFLTFINNAIWFFFVGGIFFCLGKMSMRKKKLVHYLPLLALVFAVSIVAFTASEFLLMPEVGIMNLMFSIIVGLVVLAIAKVIEIIYK